MEYLLGNISSGTENLEKGGGSPSPARMISIQLTESNTESTGKFKAAVISKNAKTLKLSR